ncbi:MAG: ABC transporter ATP-binding protein [Bacteroidales bacterium]|nr:ABC transporter ATP-binding protein [Bacteroidales bacterium]
MGDVVLNIEGLVFGHKRPLVAQAVDLSASAGDFICLVGRNGTGKTTMLNTLIGVKKPLGGQISICGVPLGKISAREKSRFISFVPSKVEAVLNMRIRDLIAVGRSPYTNIFDRRTKADNAIIEEFIQKFGLSDIADSMIAEISDGERQKAMICRAMVQQTPVILLDEPTAFLDYFAKRRLLSDLKSIATAENRCIIFSCHDLDVAVKYCSHIWLLDDRKLESVTVDEFLNGGYFSKYQ